MTDEYRAATISLMPQAGPPASGGGITIGGSTLPFAPQTSLDLGGFTEQFDGQAFRDQALAGWPGVLADFAHDGTVLLGSSTAATLRINATPAGLQYEVDVPETLSPYIGELVARGDLAGASIVFSCLSDQWGRDANDAPLRTVNAAVLRAVSLVPNPAYTGTSARVVAGGKRSRPRLRAVARSPLATTTFKEADRQLRARSDRYAREAAHARLMDDVDLALGRGRWTR